MYNDTVQMKLVAYDLVRVRDYQRLIQALGGSGGKRILESTWLVRYSGSCAALREELLNYIDNDDRLVVIQLPPGIDYAWVRALQAGADMLAKVTPVAA
jgi:hypothetical protein